MRYYYVGIVDCVVDCADCGCVVLLSVLIILIALNYVALNVLAVNVAFVVGLLSLLSCLLRHYIFDVFYYVNCLVDCANCAVLWCLVACFVLTEFTVHSWLYKRIMSMCLVNGSIST